MNLFSIGTNAVNKTAAGGNNKQAAGTGEDFLSFLSKATESDKPVQEKPKADTAEKQEPTDKAEDVTKEETGKNEQVEKEQPEEKTAVEEGQPKGEENVMAAYINQMAITPLLVNRNAANLEGTVEETIINLQTEVAENTVAVVEAESGILQQSSTQTNLQNQMLNYLNSNLTEEQQVQRLNIVDALEGEEQKVVVEQENVRVMDGENEDNPLQEKAQVIQTTDVVEETAVNQATSVMQTTEGQIHIPISDSSTVIQSQPALQVADKILVNIQNGVQEFNMTLNPEKLGQVAVKMVIENGVVNLHVQVQNAAAHNALSAGLGELRALLENNSLQVAEIEISMYSGEEQQEKETAQQENRKGQARYQGEVLVEDEVIEEEQVVMGTSELDYSV